MAVIAKKCPDIQINLIDINEVRILVTFDTKPWSLVSKNTMFLPSTNVESKSSKTNVFVSIPESLIWE